MEFSLGAEHTTLRPPLYPKLPRERNMLNYCIANNQGWKLLSLLKLKYSIQ